MPVRYVILDTSPLGNRVFGYAHSTVPGGNNDAGVAWSQAVVDSVIRDSESGTTVSLAPASLLPAGRQTQLDNGSKYEWDFSVEFSAKLSNAEKVAVVEAFLVAEEPNVIARLAKRLNFWGKTGSVS